MLFCCFSRTQVHFRAVTVEGFFPNGSQNTTVDPAHAQRTVQRKTPSLPLRLRSIVVAGHVRRSRVVYMTGRRKGEHTWADVKTSPCVRNTARKRELFPRVAMKRRKAKLLLARGGEMEAWRAILWEKEIFSPSPFHLA